MPEPGILLVEDSPDDVELVRRALNGCAHRLTVAHDGVEAMDHLRRCDVSHSLPAVVLLDLALPRMDGLQFLEAVREDVHLRHMPIVVLTSSQERRDVAQGWERGANAYVVKPLRFADFERTMRTLCEFWTTMNQPHPGNGR
jgi:CheY-like chemotaxis protein